VQVANSYEQGVNDGAGQRNEIPASNTPLHVLLPASSRDVNLCKTVLSAAVLDFPSPTVVNWGKKFTDDSMLANGSHLAKISGVLDLLETLRPEQDQDLILLVDAFDVWFQLRPSVLIERYHVINREAERRIAKRVGRAAKSGSIKQTVIFGASKHCLPNEPDDIGCFPLPESPLPKDMYGTNTDTEHGHTEHSSFRPRYLNTGFIIGPASDLRAIFQSAKQKGTEPHHGGSDQSIFNTIFGEQEFMREVMRERSLTTFDRLIQRLLDLIGKPDTRATLLNSHPFLQPKNAVQDNSYEFGIGLDYSALLGHNTADSERDGHYLTYSTPMDIHPEEFDCSPHLHPLPNDIVRSDPPFPRAKVSTKTPQSWKEVPLYTQICTGTVPVMVHHNEVGKLAREEEWTQLWIQRYARVLLEMQVKKKEAMGEEGKEVVNVGSVTLDSGGELEWWDLCTGQGFEKELFRGQ